MHELMIAALACPFLTGIIIFFLRKQTWIQGIHMLATMITSGCLFSLVYQLVQYGTLQYGILYLDALSGILLLIVGGLSFTASLCSLAYLKREAAGERKPGWYCARYYGLLHFFVFTMIAGLLVDNLGLMWVAVEATTLASALLVAFYFTRSSVEAAWKYVMVCTVGICLALLGTILLYYAQIQAGGGHDAALSWPALLSVGKGLDSGIAKLALVFLFIGYGTKIGLAPMHTWLPDAHSQAPSPISGLLSGALLSCAVYVLLRNVIVVQTAVGPEVIRWLYVGFGVFSLVISVPFLLLQYDVKRLLAYSSVENMGLISVGLGIGSPLAIYGALLHLVNHAVAKSMLFYFVGDVAQQYHTKHMLRLRKIFGAAPWAGTLLVIMVMGILGMPPMGIFNSKMAIAMAMFQQGLWQLGVGVLIIMGGVFAGILYYGMQMGMGNDSTQGKPLRLSATTSLAIGLSMMVLLITGIHIPEWFHNLLTQAVSVVQGGKG